MMNPITLSNEAQRRASARRTALLLGAVAVAIFVGFFAFTVLR
jgi:hypothetical protein